MACKIHLISCLIFFVDDSDDDDILTIKRENIDLVDIPITENDKIANKKKIITKAALAKKILRKKIIPNKKTTFDDEGQVRIIYIIFLCAIL